MEKSDTYMQGNSDLPFFGSGDLNIAYAIAIRYSLVN